MYYQILSELASGLITKNRALGYTSCAILMAQLEDVQACTDKSNSTLGPMF